MCDTEKLFKTLSNFAEDIFFLNVEKEKAEFEAKWSQLKQKSSSKIGKFSKSIIIQFEKSFPYFVKMK